MRLTTVQIHERRDFVLDRLKRGFSFLEVQKQFVKKFECHMDTARKWTNWACDQVAQEDNPKTRKRTYGVILEMYHDQIVAYQNELVELQKEITRIGNVLDRRTTIAERLEFASGSAHRELLAELAVLPAIDFTTKANLIEAKTRIRDRLYRVIQDLARLRGFHNISSDWKQALNTLLDSNLVPPAIAEGLISVIDQFEGGIRSVSDDGEAELEEDFSDLAEIPEEEELNGDPEHTAPEA
jgi:hypothetical protein